MTKAKAIEVLKSKSCTDCYGADDAYHCPDCECPVREAIHMAIEALERKQEWIPVSERLPEICEPDVYGEITFSKQVWSCQLFGSGFMWQGIDQYTINNGGGWLSEVPFDDPEECCKVVAWRPLPEPYQEDK